MPNSTLPMSAGSKSSAPLTHRASPTSRPRRLVNLVIAIAIAVAAAYWSISLEDNAERAREADYVLSSMSADEYPQQPCAARQSPARKNRDRNGRGLVGRSSICHVVWFELVP